MNPFQPADVEMHRALIEHARQKKIDARRAKKRRLAAKGKARLKRVPTSELRSEMARRRIAKTPKEKCEAWAEKAKAARAIAAHFCDHRKHPAKLRKSGKNAGFYACPSCGARVPAPTEPGGGLVT